MAMVAVVVFSNVIINKATSVTGQGRPITLYGHEYRFYAGLIISDGKASATTVISAIDGQGVPEGYMGAQATLYVDGEAKRSSAWVYNKNNATNCYAMTFALNTNSNSVYYSLGKVKLYNGNGTNSYDTYKTAELYGSAYSLPKTNVDEIIMRNSKGEIYGQEPLLEAYGIQPDLIAAIGDNEIHGYVYAEDLEGFVPNTPEEAIAYQNSHQGISRVINVYDCEGEIVLDTFTIDNTDVDENIYFE